MTSFMTSSQRRLFYKNKFPGNNNVNETMYIISSIRYLIIQTAKVHLHCFVEQCTFCMM